MPRTLQTKVSTIGADALACAYESLVIGVFWTDLDGRLLARNHCFDALIGMPPNGHRLYLTELFPGFQQGAWEALQQQLPRGEPHRRVAVLIAQDGTRRAVELCLQRVRIDALDLVLGQAFPLDEHGHDSCIDALQRDVLEAVALDRPLVDVLDLLCRRIEILAPEAICSVLGIDADGRIHSLAAPSLPADYTAALEGLPIGPHVGSCGTAAWRGEPVEVVDIATDPLWDGYRELVQPIGLAACWSTPVFDPHGRVIATFAMYYRRPRAAGAFERRMIDACVHLCRIAFLHEASRSEIQRLAFFDPLTGLPNRALLSDRAQVALQRAGRDGRTLGVAILDVDRFKTINDALGHAVGDALLQEVARRLQQCVRDLDTVGRLGGDEFVLLLPDHDAGELAALAARIRRALGERFEIGEHGFTPTASIGISQFPDDAGDFATLMKNADIAMYAAKRDGRDCARFFLASMNDAARSRQELEHALRQALAQSAFQVHYQPKVRLDGGGLAGVEALIRWQHPVLGPMPPDRFIPLAEECGLIAAIDAWVLERACAQFADWQRRLLPVPTLSVNLSAQNFAQPGLPSRVRDVLLRNGVASAQLTLEITERVMLDDTPETAADLETLYQLGITLAVDDFGTGYSSLGYLKRMPVGELKLDRSLVADLDSDPRDRALAAAVIGIGRSLGQHVVAEGVENAEQHRFLCEAGCELAQGYHYARPMPAAELERWIQHEGRRWVFDADG